MNRTLLVALGLLVSIFAVSASADVKLQWIASVYLQRGTPPEGVGQILTGDGVFGDDVPTAFKTAEEVALTEAKKKWGAAWTSVEVHGVALLTQEVSPQIPLPSERIDFSKHLAGAAYVFPKTAQQDGVHIKTPAFTIDEITIPGINYRIGGPTGRQSSNFPLNDDKLEWQVLLPDPDFHRVTFELKRQKKGANAGDFREGRWLRHGSITQAEASGYHGAGYRWYLANFDYHKVPVMPGIRPVQHGGAEVDQMGTRTAPDGADLFKKYPDGFWLVCYRAP